VLKESKSVVQGVWVVDRQAFGKRKCFHSGSLKDDEWRHHAWVSFYEKEG